MPDCTSDSAVAFVDHPRWEHPGVTTRQHSSRSKVTSRAYPEPLWNIAGTGGAVRRELSEQRRELRAVPRTGGNDDEPVDLIDDEVLVRSVREQAGRLRIRSRHQARQTPLGIADHQSAAL